MWTSHLAPAALPWLTAATFLVAWRQFPSPFHEYMSLLLELEFLALHSGGFIGLLVVWNPGRRLSRVLRWLGITVFASLYLYAGYTVLGWAGTGSMAAMILATWAGVLWAREATRTRRAIEFGLRWFLATFGFIILAGLTGMSENVDEWHTQPRAPFFGAVYFFMLGLLEASGLYRLIREW